MILLFSLILLIIPFCIVALWTKRPVASVTIATVLAYLFMVLPGLIQAFQASMIYGTGDPQLVAGGISRVIVSSALTMVIILPLLILVQAIARKKKQAKVKKGAVSEFT